MASRAGVLIRSIVWIVVSSGFAGWNAWRIWRLRMRGFAVHWPLWLLVTVWTAVLVFWLWIAWRDFGRDDFERYKGGRKVV